MTSGLDDLSDELIATILLHLPDQARRMFERTNWRMRCLTRSFGEFWPQTLVLRGDTTPTGLEAYLNDRHLFQMQFAGGLRAQYARPDRCSLTRNSVTACDMREMNTDLLEFSTSIETLASCPNLRSLTLGYCGLLRKDGLLVVLQRLGPQLAVLNATGNYTVCLRLAFDARRLPNLRKFSLRGCEWMHNFRNSVSNQCDAQMDILRKNSVCNLTHIDLRDTPLDSDRYQLRCFLRDYLVFSHKTIHVYCTADRCAGSYSSHKKQIPCDSGHCHRYDSVDHLGVCIIVCCVTEDFRME